MEFPHEPWGLLTPALSSFWGGEGDGFLAVSRFMGSIRATGFRGILAPVVFRVVKYGDRRDAWPAFRSITPFRWLKTDSSIASILETLCKRLKIF
jgi:hypothetical protein